MLHDFPFYLGIIVLIVLLILVSDKIKVAYPIILVLGGLALSIIPGIPQIHIDPELIFIIFLPPLLYEAAWNTSWKELWKWRRIISSFAFVVVFLTALAVALVANSFIPGFSLVLGFLLGGIVSPPDAVSAGAILKFVKVPRRFASILEGESLLNDASSLIIFRFAMLTVATGQFIWQDAAVSFLWMVLGGAAIGVLIAFIFYKVHRLLPTNVEMDVVLTLVSPYIIYIAAETVHSSGVLAVVCGGLFLSQKQHLFLSSGGRIKGFSVWTSFCFVLNGLVFILIGLDLPEIVSGLGEVSIMTAIGYGALISVALLVSRMLAAYGAVIVTLIARNFITVAEDRHPGYRIPFLLGWAGMRGVVSLAAALSIPVKLSDGTDFPQRNLILFITFVVILLTLVVQGLTLPFFIKKINLFREDDNQSEDEIYLHLHKKLNRESAYYIHEHYAEELEFHPTLQQLALSWKDPDEVLLDGGHLNTDGKLIMLEVINKQREWLREWNKHQELDEEFIKKHLYRLDLEEERLKY